MLIETWQNPDRESMRVGFGRGLVRAGEADERIVALSADLAQSTQISQFQEAFPGRFIEVGVSEQNLVTLASGLARAGRRPFTASYAVFSPGRTWEQIRTTICLNDQPVVIIGSHAGLNVGADGATHQMLEDIALMRSLPNMIVVAPGDSGEAERAAIALAQANKPAYVRLARDKTPMFLSADRFEIGQAQVLREGDDVALFGTGTMSYQLLVAAEKLAETGVQAEVVHVPTIKPLDDATLLASARKCGRVVTAEEAQVAGGFGDAVAALLGENLPMPLRRIGVRDRFGQSGTTAELFEEYDLSIEAITDSIKEFIAGWPQYHR